MGCDRPITLLKPMTQTGIALVLWLTAGGLVAQDARREPAANVKPATSAAEPFSHTLRVLSYNIHHAEGIDGRLDIERIAKVITSAEPDIVALQEVDSKVKRSQDADQPQELARLTGMKVVFGANIELQGGKYGNALLTRETPLHSENHPLPNIDQGEQRGILEALIKHEGQTIRILATHFDHRRDQRERLASIEKANEMASDKAQMPTLLVGDLNAEFSSEVLDRARSLWNVANTERMPTIPVTQPQRQIDFILCYPPQRWQVKEVKVLEEATASDHRPIMAILQF